jgi:hypothetical protein
MTANSGYPVKRNISESNVKTRKIVTWNNIFSNFLGFFKEKASQD